MADEEESRDTIRLHQEEVMPTDPLPAPLCPPQPFKSPPISAQHNVLRYYLFEGLRYVWMERRQAYCRVRYSSSPKNNPDPSAAPAPTPRPLCVLQSLHKSLHCAPFVPAPSLG